MKISGVYAIRNILTGTCYFGSSFNISSRFFDHKSKLNSGKHYNKRLQKDWRIYGKDKFIFEVIEETKENLLDKEQALINKSNDCYNITNMTVSKGRGRTNGVFSQIEARLVADFLRVRYAITVRNAFQFWRQRPTEVLDWIKATYPDVRVPVEKIVQAAGRDNQHG